MTPPAPANGSAGQPASPAAAGPGELTEPVDYRGVRCLVTGGAGFIGSNVTSQLLAAGAQVTVLDDFSVGRREHLPACATLRVVAADVRTVPGLEELVTGHDVVFHLAAQVGNVKSIAEPEADASINILGTVRLLRACREAPLRRLVYSSSSAIFGEAESLPIGEDHPQRPASFYALSKLTAERYALLAHHLYGVPAVCLRYFNVFGLPLEDSEYSGVISIFLRRLLAGKPLVVYGDGSQVRDFVHVGDVARANLLAGVRGRPGSVYNIGGGASTSVLELAHALREVSGVACPVTHAPARAGEVDRSVADIRKAVDELGYQPASSLRGGLAELWRSLHGGGDDDTGSPQP
jgi:UDP-glucose 4-epimerase